MLDAARATATANEDRWWLPDLLRVAARGETEPRGRAMVEAALDVAVDQRSFQLAARAAADLARRDPARLPALVARVAAIADGREDVPAATAVARWLAEPTPG